jgi:oxygen-dependent protoporphyrinogen oxidase
LVDSLRPGAGVIQGKAEALERTSSGFRVRSNGDWLEAEHVVLAMPAGTCSTLLSPIHAELADLLASIPYTSSITLSLGYRKATFDHPLKGFGFLVPKRERKLMAACTWVGNKFNYRVPDDIVLLRCFMGGNALIFQSIARWPDSMAQYTVGHEKRVERIESIMQGLPGLYLAGNAYHGIGIPDCIRMGKEAAGRIISS